MGFIVTFYLIGGSIYDPPRLAFVLWHLQYNKWTQANMTIFACIYIQPNWISWKEWLKNSFNKSIFFIINSHFYVITLWFLISLIMLSSIHNLFQALNYSSLFVVKKINYFFLKIKVCYTPLKERLKYYR